MVIEKNIVTLLCEFIREEYREVVSKAGSSSKQYLVYECPGKEIFINTNGKIAFQKGWYFTNPCSHLKSYVAHGDFEELKKINLTISR